MLGSDSDPNTGPDLYYHTPSLHGYGHQGLSISCVDGRTSKTKETVDKPYKNREILETNGMASVLSKVLIIVKDEGYNHYFQ